MSKSLSRSGAEFRSDSYQRTSTHTHTHTQTETDARTRAGTLTDGRWPVAMCMTRFGTKKLLEP